MKAESFEEDTWVYLDTKVVIEISDGLGSGRVAPAEPNTTDLNRIAYPQLFLYGRQPRRNWIRWTSSACREEILRVTGRQWLDVHLCEVDRASDRPSDEALAPEAAILRAAWVRKADAVHLAQVLLRRWIRHFVTDDINLRRRGAARAEEKGVELISSMEAVRLLDIQPGEEPPITLSRLKPGDGWWVPPASSDEGTAGRSAVPSRDG